MPLTVPSRANMFNANYDVVGEYKTDDDRRPFFVAEDSTTMILPGEPVLIEEGGDQYLYMAQGPILPGKTGYLVKRFTASFPCDLSATVEEGTEIWWDPADDTGSAVGTAVLEGDATNAFRLGVATYAYDGHTNPTLGANDLPVCGTTDSTRIYVRSLDGVCLGIGTYEYAAS